MVNALRKLGIKIKAYSDKSIIIYGDPTFSNFPEGDDIQIYLGNSGTSSRFLLALTSLLPKGGIVTFNADQRLNERPMEELITSLQDQELIEVQHLEPGKTYPMKVKSLGNQKNLKVLKIDCSETSQFASALLLVAPVLGEDEVSITLTGNIVSESYIMTSLEMLKQFGVKITYDHYSKIMF